MKRLLLLGALLGCSAALLVDTVAAAPSGAPPLPVMKKLFTQSYTDKVYATRIYSITWGRFQYGAPHTGDHWADGTPANVTERVYPVRATFIRKTHYTSDNSWVVVQIQADTVFFKDEFGTWTYRLKHEVQTKK